MREWITLLRSEIADELFARALRQPTRPRELLAALVNPLVRDPLHAGQHWACGMPGPKVTVAIPSKVVPEQSVVERREHTLAELRVHGRATLLRLRHLKEQALPCLELMADRATLMTSQSSRKLANEQSSYSNKAALVCYGKRKIINHWLLLGLRGQATRLLGKPQGTVRISL